MTLTEFLAARLDEDRELAEFLAEKHAAMGSSIEGADSIRLHMLTRDMAIRLLREVDAGRAILAEHRHVCDADHEVGDPSPGPCKTLRALAAVYSDHPDYQQEWKP